MRIESPVYLSFIVNHMEFSLYNPSVAERIEAEANGEELGGYIKVQSTYLHTGVPVDVCYEEYGDDFRMFQRIMTGAFPLGEVGADVDRDGAFDAFFEDERHDETWYDDDYRDGYYDNDNVFRLGEDAYFNEDPIY